MARDYIGQGRSGRQGGRIGGRNQNHSRRGGSGGALSPDELEEYLNRPEAPQSGDNHRGGWGQPTYGYNDAGDPITFSLGWGSKEGETLIADGHVDKASFLRSSNHNHYGKGQGPNCNAKDRGRYSGPGA